MRIVLDGSPLTVESGGIRRYTEELALALKAQDEEDEIALVCDRPLLSAGQLRAAGVQVFDQPATGWRKRWWSLGATSAARAFSASVFHGTDFTVPYCHRHPAVLTIHDLSPWRFPEWQPQAGRIRRRTPWLLRLGTADMVITVSESIRQEAIERFSLAPDRVVATPLAANSRFRPCLDDRTAPPLTANPGVEGSWPPEGYFLFVGTNEPRKNLATLIQAWVQLRRQGRPQLWIVGRMREDGFPIPPIRGIRALGNLPDDDIVRLYSRALAVLYPSFYEGFGLPVLEAMQCGAPVLVGNIPALRELVQDAGLLLPPADIRDWRDAMQSLVDDETRAFHLARGVLKRAQAFSWKATAAVTRLVYREAIARFGR